MERRRKASQRKGRTHHEEGDQQETSRDDILDDEADDECHNNHHKADGYCHFNADGDVKAFSICIFGHELKIVQDPSSRLLGKCKEVQNHIFRFLFEMLLVTPLAVTRSWGCCLGCCCSIFQVHGTRSEAVFTRFPRRKTSS